MFAKNAPLNFGATSCGADAAWFAMIARYQFALATREIQKANRKPTYGSSEPFAFEKITFA
jgi:hypothetical protein